MVYRVRRFLDGSPEREGPLPRSLRSFLHGVLLVSISNGILKASNAVLFILVVHTLGKDVAGQYSTATTLVGLALGLAQFGLDELMIREITRESASGKLFANFLALRFLLAVFFILVLGALLFTVAPYPPALRSAVLLLSVSVAGDALLLLCQALFVARGRADLVLITSLFVSLARIGLSLAAIQVWRSDLTPFILIYLLTSLAGGSLALTLSMKQVLSLPARDLLAGIRTTEVAALARRTIPFFWINVFVLAEFQADVVLISIMKETAEVATYNAALTIILAAWILPVAYRTVTFPVLTQAIARSRAGFWRSVWRVSGGGTAAGVVVAGGCALFAPVIVRILYPPDYYTSIPVLRILALPLFLAFFNAAASRALLALRLERLAVRLVAASAAVNIALNLWLIPAGGATGAAIARASSATLFSILAYGALVVHRRQEGLILEGPGGPTAL